jgi:hypothetical protein|tara:strand:- start:3518 stop:3814 length:297 start_codon:yes stop_codon:yes gene_type:complete
MNNIKLIRLVSGEEIIATVDIQGEKVTFNNPIALYAAEEGKMGFMPYMPYTTAKESGVTVDSKHILFILEPIGDIVTQYEQATGAIITPPKQGIITGV